MAKGMRSLVSKPNMKNSPPALKEKLSLILVAYLPPKTLSAGGKKVKVPKRTVKLSDGA